jgi:integral membrane protein
MSPSPDVARFRVISFLEGVSFLVLLFVAMPLKYFAGVPLAVRVVGLAHGVLFIAYCVALARCFWGPPAFSFARSARYMVLSVLPFGAFFVERELRRG